MKVFKLSFREVLGNAGFVEYINGTMLFWGCDVKTNEGNRGRLCEIPVFRTCQHILYISDFREKYWIKFLF